MFQNTKNAKNIFKKIKNNFLEIMYVLQLLLISYFLNWLRIMEKKKSTLDYQSYGSLEELAAIFLPG